MAKLKSLTGMLSEGVGAAGLMGMAGATGGVILSNIVFFCVDIEARGWEKTDVLYVCGGACAFIALSRILQQTRQWGRDEERERLQQNPDALQALINESKNRKA